MKTLYLVRHAKSSWDYGNLSDRERPLNDRGLRDAPFMAGVLSGKGVQPDAIFTSPAVRAFTTAIFFKNRLAVDARDFFLRDELYETGAGEVLDFITLFPEDLDTVMVFGHNPAFTNVANVFSKNYIPNIPTCGVVCIGADVARWPDFVPKNARIVDFFYPKQFK
ncbi:MAG: histidine phosphatase family protein [Saprospiraceae bacterium]